MLAATDLPGVKCAYARSLEVSVPLGSLGVVDGGPARFQVSLWQGNLPLDAVPEQGWLELRSTDPARLA